MQSGEPTGGEPLCQKRQSSLKRCDEGYTVLLKQTVPSPWQRYCRGDQDDRCKLPSSGYGESFLIDNLNHLQTHDQIKFVIGDKMDYEAAKDFIAQHGLKGGNILFSPVADKLEAGKLAEWILQDNLDVRLQIQLHKILDIK